VTLATARRRNRLDHQPPDGRFEIEGRDTGPGIAPEHQARIFGEFQQVDTTSTRQKGGTGLGLAISKRIIEMHGGKIELDCVIGSGSTFRVTIPIRVDPLETAARRGAYYDLIEAADGAVG
jgi:signal transduction histidine kinase